MISTIRRQNQNTSLNQSMRHLVGVLLEQTKLIALLQFDFPHVPQVLQLVSCVVQRFDQTGDARSSALEVRVARHWNATSAPCQRRTGYNFQDKKSDTFKYLTVSELQVSRFWHGF